MIDSVSIVTYNLVSELRKIFDDPEFIMGILLYTANEKNRKTVLDFIKSGNDVSVETVTVLALDLNDQG